MLRFNNNNIITGEIKQLLKEFNLPTCKVYKEGVKLYPDFFYIKGNNLYKAVMSGGQVVLEFISPYIYGDEILNQTKNLLVTNNIYDSYTHKYLGDYLRFYRDTKNINLMSMYNCFSNELPKNLNITFEGTTTLKGFTFNTENDIFKIYMVPIKFFEKYTIGIESDTKVEIVAGIYDNEKLINYSDDPSDIQLYLQTYVKKSGTRLSKPFLYENIFNLTSEVIDKKLYSQEKNLKLFIKVPATSTSSIVVLEGDYVKFSELHFEEDNTFATKQVANEICNFENRTVESSGQTFIYEGFNRERKYLSRPQLLDFNSTISYPFSERLIEYVFGSVISSDEDISKNVSRIQKRLIQRFNEFVLDKDNNIIYLLDIEGKYVLLDGTSISISDFNNLPSSDPKRKLRIPIRKNIGMGNIIKKETLWTTHLRNVCYDVILNSDIKNRSNSNKFDLIGFVDKDTEKEIGEYVEESN
jgi:hypothetical protein